MADRSARVPSGLGWALALSAPAYLLLALALAWASARAHALVGPEAHSLFPVPASAVRP